MIKASADVEKNQELLKFFHLFLSESDLSDFFQKVKAFSSTTMKKNINYTGGIKMKNKNIKKVIGIIMILCTMFLVTIPVYASNDENQFEPNKYIEQELNTWAEANGVGVVFENVYISPSRSDMSVEEIEKSVKSYVKMMKNAMQNMEVKLIERSNMARATGSYTASVESMIPAIGWGYIKQDFTANVSSSRISSVSLVGSSYDTGFTLGSWEPNYSWTDISSNKQFVQIHMKGTINYLWEGLNISKDCTFLDTFKASGSSLVESSYLDWPD